MSNYQDELIPRKEADKVGLVAIVGGLILGATFGWQSSQDRIKGNYVPQNEAAIIQKIDRDELPDLVIGGNRILLAERTDEGTVYRPLSNSDIYRIR